MDNNTPESIIAAQKAVLFDLLNECKHPESILTRLTEKDFTEGIYKAIFRACKALADSQTPIDIINAHKQCEDYYNRYGQVKVELADIRAINDKEYVTAQTEPHIQSLIKYTAKRDLFYLLSAAGAMDPLALSEKIEKTIQDIRARTTPPKEDRFLEDTLEVWSKGQDLGFNFKDFPELTKESEGLQQGLYLIGAQTNIGKTAFLSALSISVMDELPVMIFTLDDSKEDFLARMLAQMTGIPINSIKKSAGKHPDVKQAFEHLIECRNKGMFDLYDLSDITGFSQIKRMIQGKAKELPESSKPRLALFVDGLYNLDMGRETENIRTANIERANAIKALATSLNIAIMCTVETKKIDVENNGKMRLTTLHDIMETSKYAYNANVIFILNQSQDGEIVCSFAKNKKSAYKGDLFYMFDEHKAKLRETTNFVSNLTQIGTKDSKQTKSKPPNRE